MHKRRAFTLIELLVVVGIFLILAGALTPFMRMARRHAYNVNCADNLRQISLGLHNYAVEHNDAFPAALGELYPNYVTDEKTFDCPASKARGTKAKPSYEYAAGLTEESPIKTVIVQDLEENHKRYGKNVLRIDGSVQWIGEAR